MSILSGIVMISAWIIDPAVIGFVKWRSVVPSKSRTMPPIPLLLFELKNEPPTLILIIPSYFGPQSQMVAKHLEATIVIKGFARNIGRHQAVIFQVESYV